MYDLLQFIDSPDIREYNRNTNFTPAEWAVLVTKSMKKSVEEKIEALQYLADHYSADEYLLHVPLPFKKGDIVKVDFPNTEVHYGVFSCDWKRPENPKRICM